MVEVSPNNSDMFDHDVGVSNGLFFCSLLLVYLFSNWANIELLGLLSGCEKPNGLRESILAGALLVFSPSNSDILDHEFGIFSTLAEILGDSVSVVREILGGSSSDKLEMLGGELLDKRDVSWEVVGCLSVALVTKSERNKSEL